MFNWLKKTTKKVDDTLDQTKKDLGETSEKIQSVLDESSDSVKTVVKVIVIALRITNKVANGIKSIILKIRG